MSRIVDRFDEYMRFKGLDEKDLEPAPDITAEKVAEARRQGNDLSLLDATAILRHYNDMNSEWLIFGSGPMFNTSPPAQSTAGASSSPNLNGGAAIVNSYNNDAGLHLCERLLDELIQLRKESRAALDIARAENKALMAILKNLIEQKGQK